MEDDDETLPPALRRLRPGDVELAFLGTGSSAPAKYRNVSGIFLDVAVKKKKDAFADEDEDTRGARAAMFMDVGEGTLGQMVRAYGEEGAKDRLRRLRVAWISHIHADHHVGLVSVLAARREALREEWEARREKNESSPSEKERERFAPPPLLVVGPHPLRRFLDAFSQVEPLDYRFADCRAALWDPLSEAEEADPEMSEMSSDDDRRESAPDRDPLARRAAYSASDSDAARIRAAAKSMGLASFRAVPVVHCAQSYALVIVAEGGDAEEVGGDHDHDHDHDHSGHSGGGGARTAEGGSTRLSPAGWKLAYSGDTRPCPALTAASADATVLIHEATFEDGMDEDAARKRHSMTSEAIRTGRDARAYRTVLTHFSQRYPKVPAPFAGFERGGPGANENAAAGREETEAPSREERRAFGVAFDLMRVDFRRDLPRLPALLPAIRALFPDREGDDE